MRVDPLLENDGEEFAEADEDSEKGSVDEGMLSDERPHSEGDRG